MVASLIPAPGEIVVELHDPRPARPDEAEYDPMRGLTESGDLS